ncbi:MAG: extracellular solute-binding protein [Clostridia bacterium]|nr:extracellular solute-binding protein [Clostridia bacterium]
MKKLISMFLCLSMLLSVAAIAEAPTHTFTVWGILQPNTTHDTLEDNLSFQALEKITGVNLEWECITNEGIEEKRALRLAQGAENLPDLFIRAALTDDEVISLAGAGQLVDLAPLLEEYAPNFCALMERDPTIRVSITDDEGHIWSLPQICTFVETAHMIINKKWLDNLDLAVPTTVEEFYNCLVAFKEKDANGNGDPNDEIPLSVRGVKYLNYVMESFGVYPRNPYGMFVYPGTSEVQNSYIADNMKEALIFCKKLYDEGLLDHESFVQDKPTYAAKGHANRMGCMLVSGAFVEVGNELHWDYIGLPVFPDANGNAYSNARSSADGHTFVITKNCEDPIAALKMVDYLYSEEGTIMTWMGVEGETWQWINEEKTRWDWIIKDDRTVTQLRSSETIQGGVQYPAAHPVWFESDMWAKQANEIEASLDTDLFRMPLTDCCTMLWPDVTWTVEENEEMSFFLPDCENYYKASVADFVTGVRNIETEWEDYVKTMKSMNIEEGIKMYQEAYDKYMAKMN